MQHLPVTVHYAVVTIPKSNKSFSCILYVWHELLVGSACHSHSGTLVLEVLTQYVLLWLVQQVSGIWQISLYFSQFLPGSHMFCWPEPVTCYTSLLKAVVVFLWGTVFLTFFQKCMFFHIPSPNKTQSRNWGKGKNYDSPRRIKP